MSLSTPQPSSPIPPTFIPLLDAIETQIQFSSSHPPIIESTLPQVTESEQSQSTNPQETIEEATPLEFQETLGGSSSGVATTTGEPFGFQLDSGYIFKTPLKATKGQLILMVWRLLLLSKRIQPPQVGIQMILLN
ncbi:hypothetical protein Hanom_Chr17g01568751 [Helianthus anomalus]